MMKRSRLVLLHRAAGTLAFITIASFFTASVVSEWWGNKELIITVKQIILWCIPLLMGSMMLTGLSGHRLYPAKGQGVIARKQGRMKLAVINGVTIMLPAAVYLAFKARNMEFDGYFWAVQILEFIGGLTNLSLIGLNIRDGLMLKKGKWLGVE